MNATDFFKMGKCRSIALCVVLQSSCCSMKSSKANDVICSIPVPASHVAEQNGSFRRLHPQKYMSMFPAAIATRTPQILVFHTKHISVHICDSILVSV